MRCRRAGGFPAPEPNSCDPEKKTPSVGLCSIGVVGRSVMYWLLDIVRAAPVPRGGAGKLKSVRTRMADLARGPDSATG